MQRCHFPFNSNAGDRGWLLFVEFIYTASGYGATKSSHSTLEMAHPTCRQILPKRYSSSTLSETINCHSNKHLFCSVWHFLLLKQIVPFKPMNIATSLRHCYQILLETKQYQTCSQLSFKASNMKCYQQHFMLDASCPSLRNYKRILPMVHQLI